MRSRRRGAPTREHGRAFFDGGIAGLVASAAALLACSSAAPPPPRVVMIPRPAQSEGHETLHAMLVRVRQGGARDVRFESPTSEAMASVAEWTKRAVLSRRSPPAPSGFALWSSEMHPGLFALIEQGLARGSGVYVFRPAPELPWIIEVPHSFSDLRTLPIGLALFEQLGASALLVNSVHRYRGADCIEPASRKTCPSDVAHAENTLFQAVHRGILEARPESVVLAVHGFTPRDENIDVIVSAAGTHAPAECVTDALGQALDGYAVRLYPRDVQRLGGVTGAQARAAREHGVPMIHLELSRRLRDALADDAALRAKLTSALRACEYTGPNAPP